MGYTHYWYRKDKEIEKNVFSVIVSDFKKIIAAVNKLGVCLADGHGVGIPTIEENLISFNGLQKCGHPENHEFGIAWPAKYAKGIGNPWLEDVRSEPWFGGETLAKRMCSGDCSHETCYFPRVILKQDYGYFDSHPTEREGTGWHFECCKTAYKPLCEAPHKGFYVESFVM